MAETIQTEAGPVTVRRHARARRMTLRVGTVDGAAVLTLPPRARLAEGAAFARSRARWIAAQRARAPDVVRVRPGARLSVLGETLDVVAGPRARIDGGRMVVPAGTPGASAAGLVRARARVALTAACGRHAAALGRAHGRITLRDTRSRWGSCTARGDLNFSWRLALGPVEVLDYVAAHEVAHLAHMDHSPAFWAVCERLCPDWRAHRAWLRAHGAGLMAVRFDD
ncbi:MAG: M48 family metallopeptidase [Paracoccaceae bacterium]